MLTVSRVKPIQRELEVMLGRVTDPKLHAQRQAAIARKYLEEAKATNARTLGSVPPYQTFVDGVEGADETRVTPNGRIVYKFDLGSDLLAEAIELLQRFSPVRSGAYANSHEIFADGVQIDNPNDPPIAKEYVIMNTRTYSRKIEGDASRKPQSRQAPDGVYNVVADILSRRYGNIARIRFSYRSMVGGQADRNPCIVVTLR